MDFFANKLVLLLLLLVALNVVRSLFLIDLFCTYVLLLFFKDSLISVERMVFNSNMQYANFTISCLKDDKGAMLVNSTFQVVYDILKLCKASDGVVGSFAMRWYMENFQEAANYEMKCPYSKVVT